MNGLRFAPAGFAAVVSAALPRDALARRSLVELVKSRAVREAILAAAPDLAASLDQIDAIEDPATIGRVRQMVASMSALGYASVFATSAFAAIGEKTEIRFDTAEVAPRRATETARLSSMVRAQARDPAARGAMVFVPSSALYRVETGFRLLQRTEAEDGSRAHAIVELGETPALAAVIDRAERGATAAEEVRALTEIGVERESAESFLTSLVDEGVLVPELLPPLAVRASGEPPASASLQIARDDVIAIARATDLCFRLSRRYDPLASFREVFLAAYGERAVPLLEALDEDIGIGLPIGAVEIGGRPWGRREAKLLELLGEHEEEIVLTERDLEALTPTRPAAPLDAVAAIVSKGRGALLHLQAVIGPGGLGSVAPSALADPRLCAAMREHARVEEERQPDVVFAEIVHERDSSAAPSSLRPKIREHEIPYLGASDARGEARIEPRDLFVSIEHGRVVLRARDGREVAPRMASIQDVSLDDAPAYRFLCALQIGGVSWQWGPLGEAPFLPRVRWRNVVLSLARWWLRFPDLEPLIALSSAGRLAAMQRIRRRLGLPRSVTLRTGSEALSIDLEDGASVSMLVEAARRGRGDMLLYEVFSDVGPDEIERHWVVPLVSERPVAELTMIPKIGVGAQRETELRLATTDIRPVPSIADARVAERPEARRELDAERAHRERREQPETVATADSIEHGEVRARAHRHEQPR